MALGTATGPGQSSPSAELAAWLDRQPGSLLAEYEGHALGQILPDLFGYHIVQLGCHHHADLIESSRISHRVRLELGGNGAGEAQCLCSEDAIPLANNSVDVIVVPHVLEFADDPRRVLREVERVLIGEGHAVILAFNPFSWVGLGSLLKRWQGRAPWNGHFIALNRIKDWLQLLGFDIISQQRLGFRPPTRRAGLNERLAFLERLGAHCWPMLGNVFMVVARKRVEGVTPLKAHWRQRRRLVAGSVTTPSTRSINGEALNDNG